MHNTLIYLPTGLNSPELEILISQTQEEIDKNNKVFILLCRGGKNYYCSKNVFSSKFICFTCKNLQKKAIRKIKGKFEIIYTPEIFYKRENYIKKFNLINLHKYKYLNCDNGLSSYSSYIANTSDRDLDGFLAKKIIYKLINTSNYLTLYFKNILIKFSIHKVILFNGRMNNYRPLLNIAQNIGVDCNNLEFNGFRNQGFNFKDHLPIDRKYLSKRMILNWNYNKNKIRLVKTFLNHKINNQSLFHSKQFTFQQKKGLLPSNWNNKNFNVVFFASSDDENITGGKEYYFQIYKTQIEAIIKIYNSLKDLDKPKKTVFWLRLHPRMDGINWPYLRDIKNLKKKYPNMNVVESKSLVSSYALLKECDFVISPLSTLSIDALYFNKPVVNLIKSSFSELNGSYIPKNHNDLIKIITSNNKPKSSIASFKFDLFYLTGGFKVKFLKGNMIDGYKYKDKFIKMSIFIRIIYLIGKSIDRYIFNFVFNYFLFRIFSFFLNVLKR